jgi:hypothetical protein
MTVQIDDAITGVVLSERVQRIRQCETGADELQWEAARLIAEELDSGTTQQVLAEQIGKSQSHVSLAAKTWRYYLGNNPLPPFNDAYHSPEVRGSKAKPITPKATPAPQPEPPVSEPVSTPPTFLARPMGARHRQHL